MPISGLSDSLTMIGPFHVRDESTERSRMVAADCMDPLDRIAASIHRPIGCTGGRHKSRRSTTTDKRQQ